MNYSKENQPLLTSSEIEYWNALSEISLTGAAIDTLIALVENGPLEDGDVPSKSGRNELLSLRVCGYTVVDKIICNSKDGYQAATYVGRDLYKTLLLNDPFNGNINEAKSNRLANELLCKLNK